MVEQWESLGSPSSSSAPAQFADQQQPGLLDLLHHVLPPAAPPTAEMQMQQQAAPLMLLLQPYATQQGLQLGMWHSASSAGSMGDAAAEAVGTSNQPPGGGSSCSSSSSIMPALLPAMAASSAQFASHAALQHVAGGLSAAAAILAASADSGRSSGLCARSPGQVLAEQQPAAAAGEQLRLLSLPPAAHQPPLHELAAGSMAGLGGSSAAAQLGLDGSSGICRGVLASPAWDAAAAGCGPGTHDGSSIVFLEQFPRCQQLVELLKPHAGSSKVTPMMVLYNWAVKVRWGGAAGCNDGGSRVQTGSLQAVRWSQAQMLSCQCSTMCRVCLWLSPFWHSR